MQTRSRSSLSVLLMAAVVGTIGGPTSLATAADTEHHEAATLPITGPSENATASQDGLVKPVEIKGTGLTLKFGGFAKVDFIQDIDPIGNEDQFKVNSIPIEGTSAAAIGGQNHLSARQTRFSLDVRGDTSDGMVHGYFEGDFFGSGNSFRMRHGYGEWKGLLGGQTWSTFQDITARPFTLDYEGPDSEFFVRQPQVRYTGHPSEKVEWSIAAESADSDLTTPSSATGGGRNQMPDFPARVRIKPNKGAHIQIAAMVRQLRYVSGDGMMKASTMGYGFNVAGKATVAGKDAIMGHAGYGSGVTRYIEAFSGTGSDGVLTADGEITALNAWAATLGYSHQWNDHWSSTLAGGRAQIDNDASQSGGAIKAATSVHMNLVCKPNRLLALGGELMWGERENANGDKGDAMRVQLSAQFKFN